MAQNYHGTPAGGGIANQGANWSAGVRGRHSGGGATVVVDELIESGGQEHSAHLSKCSQRQPRSTNEWPAYLWSLLFLAFAVITLLVHGYHPLAEDGGLYVAHVQYALDPSLFPGDVFVRNTLRFSLFSTVLAWLVSATRLPLPRVLFLFDIGALALTFYGGREVLRRCVSNEAAELAGLALFAAWATLPVAGTSLLLLDPYVTARSVSTPLCLLTLAYALDDWSGHFVASRGSLFACSLCLLGSFLFHPLMAAYTLAYVLCLRLGRIARNPWLVFAIMAALAIATGAGIAALSPTESHAAHEAVLTRKYWFLSEWRWYEICGLAGPLLILLFLRRAPRVAVKSSLTSPEAEHVRRNQLNLIDAGTALGLIAILVALLFAHQTSSTHQVARLQPLRCFLPIYAMMILLLGASLFQMLDTARGVLSSSGSRTVVGALPYATILILAAIMFVVQRKTFPDSPHLEMPWTNSNSYAAFDYPQNQWSKAFLWARDNTPQDALFAVDPNYITSPGEDAQNFRATAERSVLPDFSKDGGQASITPPLADVWEQQVSSQHDLSGLSDDLRDSRLVPLGVTWMLLRSSASTVHSCPYDNGTVKICSL